MSELCFFNRTHPLVANYDWLIEIENFTEYCPDLIYFSYAVAIRIGGIRRYTGNNNSKYNFISNISFLSTVRGKFDIADEVKCLIREYMYINTHNLWNVSCSNATNPIVGIPFVTIDDTIPNKLTMNKMINIIVEKIVLKLFSYECIIQSGTVLEIEKI